MPSKIEFTKEQREEIVKLYVSRTTNAKKIGKQFECSKQTICRVLREEGVEHIAKKVPPRIEKLVLGAYENEVPVDEICQMHQVNKTTIYRILKRNESKPSRAHSYPLNENVFDILDDEASVYWSSFIFSDGCVYQNQVRIMLSVADIGHLEKLRSFLETDERPIYTFKHTNFNNNTSERALLAFKNKYVADTLRSLGVTAGRPNAHRLTDAVPSHLAHHCLRALIDADGCIDRNRPRIRLSSNYTTLAWMRDTLAKDVHTNPDMPIKQCTRGNIKTIAYGGGIQVSRILHYLYKDATVYLDRKKAIADTWMR